MAVNYSVQLFGNDTFVEGPSESFSDGQNFDDLFEEYDWEYYYDVIYTRKMRQLVYPAPHEWVVIFAFAIVFLLALIGNILVCYAVLRNPQMRTVTNYYIVNLSVADILVSLICLPITVVFDVTETWYFGNLACKLIPYFQVISMSVSVLTLSAIAVDRYFAICRPLMFKSTAKRTLTIILVIWLVSFLIPIPQAIVYETRPAADANRTASEYIFMTKCFEIGWFGTLQQKIYHIALVMVIYLIPLILIGVAYIMVCLQLWASIPGFDESKNQQHDANGSGANRTTVSQLKSRRKVAKMLIIVVVLFAICYLPLHILNILRQFPLFVVVHAARDSFHIPFLVAHWLAFANSAVNPIVYNFLSAKFRKEFKAAFTCCLCCFRSKRRKRKRRGGYVMNNSMMSTSKTYGNNYSTEQITMTTIKSGVHV
ncbi:orexin receptor type 2-like [Ptychodera flava]|uniref:orexin receptor type 2-like n=1 Tax=Ptychodera flava TaxID=63121 RepID=UPI00396A3964